MIYAVACSPSVCLSCRTIGSHTCVCMCVCACLCVQSVCVHARMQSVCVHVCVHVCKVCVVL